MAVKEGTIWAMLFGAGKGSGASLMMFVLGVAGVIMVVVSGSIMKKYKYTE